jgi:hypothetical protein
MIFAVIFEITIQPFNNSNRSRKNIICVVTSNYPIKVCIHFQNISMYIIIDNIRFRRGKEPHRDLIFIEIRENKNIKNDLNYYIED